MRRDDRWYWVALISSIIVMAVGAGACVAWAVTQFADALRYP